MEELKLILKSKNKFSILIFVILTGIANLVFAFTAKIVLDNITLNTSDEISYFLKSLAIFILFVIFVMFVDYATQYSALLFTREYITKLRHDIFSTALIDYKHSKNYISTATNDINYLEQNYYMKIIDIFSNLVIFIFASGALFIFNPLHSFITVVLSLFYFVLFRPFSKTIEMKSFSVSKYNRVYVSFIDDIFSGSKIIRQFSVNEKTETEHLKVLNGIEDAKIEVGKTKTALFALSNAYQVFLYMFTMCLGSYFVIKKVYTIGMMMAATQLLPKISFSARLIISDYANIKASRPILCDIRNKIESHYSKTSSDKLLDSKFNYDEINIRNLNFSYNNIKVFHNLNISFKKNKKYAIIGSSGAGKSTIFKLLLKEENVDKDQIFLNNVDLYDISDEEILKNISCMNQNVFLFSDTIKNNILLYKNVDDNIYHNIIKMCKLDTFIESFPDGDFHKIDINGENISGGQKQRIALARAILSNTKILLLDEAFSSLDHSTTRDILLSILELDVLVISIMHQYDKEILYKFDEIIDLDTMKS